MSPQKQTFRSGRKTANSKPAKRSLKPLPTRGIIRSFFGRHPVIGYVALTLMLMVSIQLLEEGAGLFKASILESQITFDGTVLPVQKVPNWVQTGGRNDRAYSDYSAKELIPLMVYDPDFLLSKTATAAVQNAQITYTVPYLGNYEYDHREEAGSHLGVDMRMPSGTPIFAVANAIVNRAEPDGTGGFGKMIVLKVPKAPLANGKKEAIYVGYGHLSDVTVSEGEMVRKGDLIGYSGQTGTATTPHLHFQIDLDKAPYHLFWPFTSAEASAAGLSFFEAINAGLGMERAKENTLNPLMWVQQNLNGDHAAPSEEPEEAEISGELDEFELEASPTEVRSGEEFTLTARALDQEGNLLRSFNRSAKISSSDGTIDLPNLQFSNGKASAEIPTGNSGRVKFTVSSGSVSESIRVTVLENEYGSEGGAEEIDPDAESEFDHLEITSRSPFVLLDEHATLEVRAVDSAGALTNFDLRGAVPISADQGRVSPDSLDSGDFKNGRATVEFTPSEPGNAQIAFGDFGAFEIPVLSELKPVSAFKVESDGKFIPGVSEEVIISTLDDEGNFTPLALYGTARITFSEGAGLAKTPELTSKDFENGIVKVTIVVTSGDSARIKVQAGVVVGESKTLSEERGKVFADVDENDDYAAAIKFLKDQGIVSGYPDGTFKSDQTIIRVEVAKMILEGLRIPLVSGKSSLKDIPANQWFTEYVVTAEQKKIIDGYPDGTFKPTQAINMAEFFKILLEADEAPLADEVYDEPCTGMNPKQWFARYFLYAKENRLLDFDRRCSPEKEITRGEVAEAMFRVLN